MTSLHQPKQPQNRTEGQQKPGSTAGSHTTTRSPKGGSASRVFRVERPRASGLCPARCPSSRTKPQGRGRPRLSPAYRLSRSPFLADLGQIPAPLPCMTSAACAGLSHCRLFCNPKDCGSSVMTFPRQEYWAAIPDSRESLLAQGSSPSPEF